MSETTIQTPWLSPDEAVEYLRLKSVRALYQAVRRGLFRCHRQANRTMIFHRTELDEDLLKR